MGIVQHASANPMLVFWASCYLDVYSADVDCLNTLGFAHRYSFTQLSVMPCTGMLASLPIRPATAGSLSPDWEYHALLCTSQPADPLSLSPILNQGAHVAPEHLHPTKH